MDIEKLFNKINTLEDLIASIDDLDLYDYVINCIQCNEYCYMDNYLEYKNR